jgi:putative YhbY family RNA-binding protein
LVRAIRYTPIMPVLSSSERRALRARAHHLRPFISVGESGITTPVLGEIERCLRSHELIKVRVLAGDRHEREAMIGEICCALGAHPVQHIGKILVVYRPRPDDPAQDAPARKTGRHAGAGRQPRARRKAAGKR